MFAFIFSLFVLTVAIASENKELKEKNTFDLIINCVITFLFFFFTVPYRMLQTQVEGMAQTKARVLPVSHPPGLCPEEAHSVAASGAPVAKLSAVTLQPPQVVLLPLSSRLRIHLSSALSTCSLCLSEL